MKVGCKSFLLAIFFMFLFQACDGLLKRKLPLKPNPNIATRVISEVDEFSKQLSRYSIEEIHKCNAFFQKYNKKFVHESDKQKATLNFLHNQHENFLHNLEFLEGLQTFIRASNEHSDLSAEEFSSLVNKFRRPVEFKSAKSNEVRGKLPKSLNYVAKGFVTPVQKQGLCGSCWSFSAIGAIEGQIFKETGKLTKFSEQCLIDCNRDDELGNFGCDGGDMTTAYSFLIDQKGVALAATYPYRSLDINECGYKKSLSGGVVVSFELIEAGDEKLLQSKLVEHGPIAVAVDASLSSFQNYKSGIYLEHKCSKNVNHAVLLVGYGTDKATKRDYWLVKNSYGVEWGEKGYIKMARKADNHCGIAEYPVVPRCKAKH